MSVCDLCGTMLGAEKEFLPIHAFDLYESAGVASASMPAVAKIAECPNCSLLQNSFASSPKKTVTDYDVYEGRLEPIAASAVRCANNSIASTSKHKLVANMAHGALAKSIAGAYGGVAMNRAAIGSNDSVDIIALNGLENDASLIDSACQIMQEGTITVIELLDASHEFFWSDYSRVSPWRKYHFTAKAVSALLERMVLVPFDIKYDGYVTSILCRRDTKIKRKTAATKCTMYGDFASAYELFAGAWKQWQAEKERTLFVTDYPRAQSLIDQFGWNGDVVSVADLGKEMYLAGGRPLLQKPVDDSREKWYADSSMKCDSGMNVVIPPYGFLETLDIGIPEWWHKFVNLGNHKMRKLAR